MDMTATVALAVCVHWILCGLLIDLLCVLQMVRLDEVPEAFSGVASVDRGDSDASSPQ